MAKRKKQTKRRRRVGGLKLGGKDTGVKLLAVGAGFLLGNTINGYIDKMLPKTTDTTPVVTTNGKMLATVGELGIGGMLLLSKKSGTAGMAMKGVGGLLAGAGLKRALAVLGVVSGYQSVPVIGKHRMAGYQTVPVIGASTVPSQLSGKTPVQLSGYRSQGSGVGAYIPAGSGVGVMGSIGNCDNGSGITNDGSGYMN